MRRVKVPYRGTFIYLDLRKIDHQQTFLDRADRHEPEEQELLAYLVPESGTAIDVGANLGLYTVTLAQLVGLEGRVVSYEPEVDALLRNTALLPQVTVRPVAVSDANQQVVFRRYRSTALSRIVPGSQATKRDALITSVSLDSECSRLKLNAVDFLKIDVEGSEAEVLAGARKLLSGTNPPVVFFEWIPDFRSRWEQSAVQVLKSIVGNDWRLFRVGWNRPIAEIRNFEEPEEEANIIAFPPSRATALQGFLKYSKLEDLAASRPALPLPDSGFESGYRPTEQAIARS